MITQTLALFIDAYRELNAKKLFWIVLGLSALFVGAFAGVGINERGIVLFFWEIPNEFLNLQVLPSRAFFYKTMFFSLGFQIWLTWIATILALVSTCGIIPDFVASGSIELTLSKPIGRVRLLLTKILAAMTFVFLQVGVFTVASFVIIGIRGGEWVWSLFLAIPLVLLFFSYLYSICAVVGLVTRSTIAALLLAILFWFVIFIIHTSETIFLQFREVQHQAVAILEGRIETDRGILARAEDDGDPQDDIDTIREQIADKEDDLEAARKDMQTWNRVHAIGYAVKTILPKTTETMELLGRYVISDEELTSQMQNTNDAGNAFGGTEVHGVYVSNRVVTQELQKKIRSRSVFWIIGTSVAFEAAVLGLGCFHFARRDY